MEIYKFVDHPPANFIAQMAFTSLNTFLLTTDGRVFSWGAVHYCLGREMSDRNNGSKIPVATENMAHLAQN